MPSWSFTGIAGSDQPGRTAEEEQLECLPFTSRSTQTRRDTNSLISSEAFLYFRSSDRRWSWPSPIHPRLPFLSLQSHLLLVILSDEFSMLALMYWQIIYNYNRVILAYVLQLQEQSKTEAQPKNNSSVFHSPAEQLQPDQSITVRIFSSRMNLIMLIPWMINEA